MEKGLLVVLSGPTGCGKGTVLKALMQRSDEFAISVSATTRAPREGEIDGKSYHFITKEDFEERIKAGEMLEYNEFCGNYYGTPKKEAEKVLSDGKNLILEIEVNGAMNVKAKYPDAVLIMLLPPSHKVQEERLRGRGTETDEVIKNRLATTEYELSKFENYDYAVINKEGGIEKAADKILSIVTAEKCAVKRNKEIKENFFK